MYRPLYALPELMGGGHPFQALEAEYLHDLSRFDITNPGKVIKRARELLPLKPRYASVSAGTGVPIVWLMAVNEREGSSSFHTYFGNGQDLHHRTTEVPAGRGPFDSWEEGCIDALKYDHIVLVKDWTWARAVYESEAWNGFGPRNKGLPSGYPWAGSNIYRGGKYVEDRVWSRGTWDTQLGTVPLMRMLVDLDHSLDLPGWPGTEPVTPPMPVDGGPHGTAWVQQSLNALLPDYLLPPLIVDNDYGRKTARGVREFQRRNDLTVDGFVGPITTTALELAMGKVVRLAA